MEFYFFFPVVTIFFAVKLNKAELPEWMDWIMVAFVAFHVVMHLILSVSIYCALASLLLINNFIMFYTMYDHFV